MGFNSVFKGLTYSTHVIEAISAVSRSWRTCWRYAKFHTNLRFTLHTAFYFTV